MLYVNHEQVARLWVPQERYEYPRVRVDAQMLLGEALGRLAHGRVSDLLAGWEGPTATAEFVLNHVTECFASACHAEGLSVIAVSAGKRGAARWMPYALNRVCELAPVEGAAGPLGGAQTAISSRSVVVVAEGPEAALAGLVEARDEMLRGMTPFERKQAGLAA